MTRPKSLLLRRHQAGRREHNRTIAHRPTTQPDHHERKSERKLNGQSNGHRSDTVVSHLVQAILGALSTDLSERSTASQSVVLDGASHANLEKSTPVQQLAPAAAEPAEAHSVVGHQCYPAKHGGHLYGAHQDGQQTKSDGQQAPDNERRIGAHLVECKPQICLPYQRQIAGKQPAKLLNDELQRFLQKQRYVSERETLHFLCFARLNACSRLIYMFFKIFSPHVDRF